jgi:hypothetical protein
VISTLSKLGNFSKAMWKVRCTKLHDPNNISSPTADLDAETAHCYANPQDILAADRQLLHKPISKVLKSRRSAKTTFLPSLKSASKGSILSATSLTRQFPLLHPLILTFVFHKLYTQIPRRSCACQNRLIVAVQLTNEQ